MVEVVGNIDNLQLDIDSYLSFIARDGVKDYTTTRDEYFAVFDREYSYREENFLEFREVISDNYIINTDVEPELVGEECIFEEGFSYFTSVEDEGELLVGDECVFDENVSYFSNSVEEVYEDLGGDDEFVEYSSSDDDDDEFIDYSSSSDDEFVEYNNSNEEVDEVVEDWGSIDDDDLFNEYGSDEVVDIVDEVEDDPFNEYGFDVVEEDDPFAESIVDDFNEESGVVENNTSDWGIKDLPSYTESSVEDDDGFIFEETKNVVVDVPEKVIVEELINVPSDLREFVNMYPNCELSFVYKYFSKKEVEKQLRLGRVFKRKNKLLI